MGGMPGGPGGHMEMLINQKTAFVMIFGCFKECINNFKIDSVDDREKVCLNNCAQRSGHAMTELQNVKPPGMM